MFIFIIISLVSNLGLAFPTIDKTIYVSSEDMNKLKSNFQYFDKEYGYCIYETEENMITFIDGTDMIRNYDTVEFSCKITDNYVGTLHTHTYSFTSCGPSDMDIEAFFRSDVKFQGIMCSSNAFVLYEKINDNIYKIKVEMI